MGGLPGWLMVVAVLTVVLAVLFGVWCSWTAGRLDRMHLRVEAAGASLNAQLQHRASVATELAAGGLTDPASALVLLDAARAAREGRFDGTSQWLAESDLTAALFAVELPAADDEPLMAELVETARSAGMARRIHNDIAATTQRLHQRRRVRWFHLAGHAVAPQMIDFDDRSTFSR